MDSIENDMHGIKCSFTETHKSFPIYFGLEGVCAYVKFLKFIVTYLHCTKYNIVQKHVSYTGSHKRFIIYYGLYLETAGYVF